LELGEEAIGAFLVRVVEIEAPIPWIEVALERSHPRFARLVGRFAVVDEFAVAAITDAGFPRPVPQIPLSRARHREIAFRGIGILAMPVVAIAEWPEFFHKIGGIRPHAPLVTVRAHFALDVKIIEQYELARELVVIGRDFFPEQAKGRVAIALRNVT